MAYVNPSTQNLKTCFQSHYSLPYFQREYKWEPRHFSELLNDIQAAFLLSYDPTHGRKEVANYAPYFLGSIITSAEADGKKPLIDGQQRLTSTFLILAVLERTRRDKNVENALNLSTLLGSVSYGAMDYSIEFSNSRKAIFDAYLDTTKPLGQALETAEDLPNLDDGDRRLLDALRATDGLLDSTVKDAIPYFIDYVVERVLIIDISVASEAEAHRVFVTMNDRGLRLGPIDLLKGQILSRIPNPADSQSCHTTWVQSVNRLRSLGAEEDSLFFRTLFRAKWAETIRGKAKGDAPGDFDVIGESYHRWFADNTGKLNIQTADDYLRFARDDIPKYAEIYSFIKSAEDNLTVGLEYLYYNSIRKFSLQPMVLMAAVSVNDTTSDWQRKIILVARLFDILLTSRTIEGRQNNYENLRDIAFAMTKAVRGKTFADLLDYVRSEWPKYNAKIVDVSQLSYTTADKSDLLFMLARIACHLEDKFAFTNKTGFTTFWQRDRGRKTFDIEHILKVAFDPASLPATHGFADNNDYFIQRNLLGALTLLPRSRNRSLQDKPYKEKLAAYATENVLTQTLCDALYTSNPNVASFVTDNPAVGLNPIADFTKADISSRAATYTEIAKQVWATP